MEHDKISELLNDSTVSKFVTRKWIEVNNLSFNLISRENSKKMEQCFFIAK